MAHKVMDGMTLAELEVLVSDERKPPKVSKGCIIKDCDRLHHARGLCRLHYERWRTRTRRTA